MTGDVQHPLLTVMQGPPRREIEKVFITGLVVSTVEAHDGGWETAISVQGADDWHPVERYENKTAAEAGHAKWVELAPSLTEVTDLGLPGWTEPCVVSLARP